MLLTRINSERTPIILLLIYMTFSVFTCTFAYSAENGKSRLPELPLILPEPDPWGIIRVPDQQQKMRSLTIDQSMQRGLKLYLRIHGNPIAAAVVVEVSSGKIIAMVQGKNPASWGAGVHSALYEGFPAASLFKIVPTIAALDIAYLEPASILGLTGGCAKVHPRGYWMRDVRPVRPHSMSLGRAFANSCNSFYAKITLKYLGVGVLNRYAKQLGWGESLPLDFSLKPSPISPPAPAKSAIHNIGRYAAGFGKVGLSPVHAAWINLVIARDGYSAPLSIFADRDPLKEAGKGFGSQQIVSETGSLKIREMMQRTVRSGTASSAFRRWGMRNIKRTAGGKTGTLNSQNPEGLATWFAGLMPWKKPEIVVIALVVNGNRWVIKGSHLAAEAFRLWEKKKRSERISSGNPSSKLPKTTES